MHGYENPAESICLRKGMSLVEVLIGMTILSIVVMAGIAALPEIRQVTYRSDQYREAATILGAQLEELRTLTYEQLSDRIDADQNNYGDTMKSSWDNSTLEDVAYTKSEITFNGSPYTVEEITNYMSWNGTTEKAIQSHVTVSWDGPIKKESISAYTVFTENGLSDRKFSLAN
ncbi:prepilin-type N-terminal cleavage/methylation domain-containing protein [Rubellicoccus peritrichatus]|uniref:Prepilin-type N-terminal cleavage/methylation domain-containing protein n=1 Tax=Rubellicoccus peritrichatus TaxID=3080537 RepID=A0AAQ3L8U0_9BACT|nr:prepilin-type N-terminal cleavage/methylation domain-containing protein [Puniceicoccus sp. CR14]WOO41774.1 prepilin-type N-terminal cleavage/methylation domain-containing protein [Puniceicoccus sp. CR14]